MRSRSPVALLAPLALVLALGACSRRADSRAASRIKLRVAMQPYLTQAPLLIAQADSLFANEGLDVEFVRIANSTEGVAPLLSGELDVLPSSLSPGLLNSMARDLPVRMVADRGFVDPAGCTFMAIAVPPGRAAAANADPHRVKRVSIERQHAMLYVIEKSLQSVGLSLESLTTSVVPPLPEADALGKGTLDAAFVGEPWIARDVAAGKAELWIRAERVLPGLQSGFIFFGPSLLKRNPDAGHRFLIAYRRAIGRYLEGKTPANVALLARETGDTPDLVKRSCWPPMRPDSRVELASVQQYQRWLQAKGLVSVPATPRQMWDSSFLVYADSVLSRRHQLATGNSHE
ncbi:MAG: ABC transporter substrate-binding protein [Gemmatimonadota bacterium]|nr:ABC transporter substrate-binding protein [Gemmatimonadota bacterium]